MGAKIAEKKPYAGSLRKRKGSYLCHCQSAAMKALFRFFYHHKKRTAWIAVLWTLLILVACLIPGNEIPDVKVPLADKWVHFAIFGGFAFLWICVYRHPGTRKGIFIALLTAALGYAVELLQGSGITRGRSYDPYDLLADSIGGILGLVAFFALRRHAGTPT